MDGISKISSYLVNARFRMEEAKVFASRATLLAALIRAQMKDKDIKKIRWNSDKISELPSLKLKAPMENINRIKTLIPEAFYNLYIAQNLSS